jgi:hypothetical protein
MPFYLLGMHIITGMSAHKNMHLLIQIWRRYAINMRISNGYNCSRRREAIFAVSGRDFKTLFIQPT